MYGRAYQTLFGQLNLEIANLDDGTETERVEDAPSQPQPQPQPQPASRSSYPHVIVQTTHHHVRENESCAICLEKYTLQEVSHMLTCQHRFHEQCIAPWLQDHPECPLCKVNVFSRVN